MTDLLEPANQGGLFLLAAMVKVNTEGDAI